ncbi:hypothetical protein [Cognatiluteimonas telluris]|jgi:Na+-translocating ferredoxin:NAD+ oxidoreductase RnfC subunit|uniref:hypothetical protein n=1 Tax=Cognatiluteimonas telluris TaxID=1104775 RepID=UPI00140E1167
MAHRIATALADGDLDAAMGAGLLDSAPCDGCTPACRAALLSARDERRIALKARERFRARQARLARRQAERAASRDSSPIANATAPTLATTPLPPAAAAALERAMARAAGRHRK